MYTVHCSVIVDNKCEFQHSSSQGGCNCDARLVGKTRKNQRTNISGIRPDDHRSPTQVPCKKRRRHIRISQSVNRSQLVSFAKRFLSNQSIASTRSNASRQIHPGCRSDQLLSFTNTDKSWVTARIVFIGYGNLVWRHSPNTQSCDSAWTATSQSGVCKFEPKHDV